MPPRRFPKREPVGRKPPAASMYPHTDNSPTLPEENENYEEELAWCIHRLKITLTMKNLTSKQMDDLRRNVSVLENPSESIVKKRCLMRTALGNYRQQMEKEKLKLPNELKTAAIAPSTSSSCQFRRKAASSQELSSKFSFQPSDNSFKFNFDCSTEEKNE